MALDRIAGRWTDIVASLTSASSSFATCLTAMEPNSYMLIAVGRCDKIVKVSQLQHKSGHIFSKNRVEVTHKKTIHTWASSEVPLNTWTFAGEDTRSPRVSLDWPSCWNASTCWTTAFEGMFGRMLTNFGWLLLFTAHDPWWNIILALDR